MKFKDWMEYEFPIEEIIAGGSAVNGSDAPVKHTIGMAPQSSPHFDFELLNYFENLNEKLCYHNVRKHAADGSHRRRRMLRNLNRYGFMTIDGWTINRHKVVSFNEFFNSLLNHKFCVSPEGNGIDCHRHYETILAKGIPIVQIPDEEYVNERWGTNSYMEKYDDLPVLWTKDYAELSVEYLEEKYEEFLETEFDFSRMTKSYWREHSSDIDECTNYWMGVFG